MPRAGRQPMDFEQLLVLQDELDSQLCNRQITWEQYENEWLSLLKAAGWTHSEYEREIDERWDRLDALRTKPSRRFGMA